MSPRAAPLPGQRSLRLRRRPPPPDRSRLHGRSESGSWLTLRVNDVEIIQPLTDLPQGLKDVSAGALGRAVKALADGVVVELVDLAHGEGGALLERERGHEAVDLLAGLVGDGLAFRP